VCLFATGLKKAKTEGRKCHAKTMKSKKNHGKTLKEAPFIRRLDKHRGETTREGAKSVVGLLERMNPGGGINGLDDKSRGMEILMTEVFVKINPTESLKLTKQAARRERK
jgi:hypothetical protein